MQRVACAILIENGAVLLGKRASHKRICPDQWDIIGGHVEAGENPDQAMLREVHEELGVTISEFTELRTISEPKRELGGPSIFHVYLVKSWKGTIAILGNEHVELRWFSLPIACNLSDLAHPAYPDIFHEIMRSPDFATPSHSLSDPSPLA